MCFISQVSVLFVSFSQQPVIFEFFPSLSFKFVYLLFCFHLSTALLYIHSSSFPLHSIFSPCLHQSHWQALVAPSPLIFVLIATCYFQHFIILISLPKSSFIFLNFFFFSAHLSLLSVALNQQHQGRELKHTDDQRAWWKMKAQNIACVSKMGAHKHKCRKVHLIGQSRQSNRSIRIEIKEDEGQDEMSKLSITYCITVSLNQPCKSILIRTDALLSQRGKSESSLSCH